MSLTIEQIAGIAHEANRSSPKALGDDSQPSWADAPAWQAESAIDGVIHVIGTPEAGPEASHENWIQQKIADGWSWGPVKDAELKTHPCLVPFAELPLEQQVEDHLFRAVVGALFVGGVDC